MSDTELQTTDPTPTPLPPAEILIAQAIKKGASIDTLERLLALRKEVLAEKAKEAFNTSMAAFQDECPIIEKKTSVDGKYKYAKIDSIVSQVRPFIRKHGFRYATTMRVDGGDIIATVRVVHTLGHEEVSEMKVPSGSGTSLMSAPQKVASATTFAKRYAFLNAFGIMTGDEDNDTADQRKDAPAAPAPAATVTPAKPKPTPMVVIEKMGEAKGAPGLDTIYLQALRYEWTAEEKQMITDAYLNHLIRVTGWLLRGMDFVKPTGELVGTATITDGIATIKAAQAEAAPAGQPTEADIAAAEDAAKLAA